MSQLLPLDHFSLQLTYAQRAATIANLPLEQALMAFTQYWARVNRFSDLRENNLTWSFDPSTPAWRELVTRIGSGEAADHVAYELYIRNNEPPADDKGYFGCFRFDFLLDSASIKLHFHNRDHLGYGPLSQVRQPERQRELAAMFSAICERYPQAKSVEGGSWLYNIEAYKRLFPVSFTAHMTVEEIPFPRSSGIWGQFLNSESEVKRDVADAFLLRANAATSVDQLLQCFPYKILYPSCNIADFYIHYGLTDGEV